MDQGQNRQIQGQGQMREGQGQLLDVQDQGRVKKNKSGPRLDLRQTLTTCFQFNSNKCQYVFLLTVQCTVVNTISALLQTTLLLEHRVLGLQCSV